MWRPGESTATSSPERGAHGRLAGIATLCAAMLLWPVVEAIPTFFSHRYSAIEVVWVRYSTHLLLMLVLWAPVGPARLVRTRRPGLHVVRAFTMLGLPVFYVLAIARMPVDTVLSLFWLAPLLAMLLAAVWLREWTGWRQWIAAVAAYLGALVIVGRPVAGVRAAAVLPLAMALCFALYQVLTRFMHDETTAARLFYTALGVWGPLSLVLPWFWTMPTPRDLALMMLIGVLGFLFLLGLDRALDVAPVSRLAPFTLAHAVWGVLVSFVLTRHRPAPGAVAGVAIVLVAWIAFAWPPRSEATPTLH